MSDEKSMVFVIDDDEAVRSSLALLLKSMSLAVETFESANEFLQKLPPDPCGCLVLDIRMPGMSGIELQQQLKQRGYPLPIIFITGHGDVSMAVHAMREGAIDFIEKPFRDQELLDRIYQALEIDRARRRAADETVQIRERFAGLTPREHEVMLRIARGQANKVIAIELGLSERTVEIHRAKVMHKTGARSLAELVGMAAKLGAA
jgi:two-component system, LuxR family, response regulator FixJ